MALSLAYQQRITGRAFVSDGTACSFQDNTDDGMQNPVEVCEPDRLSMMPIASISLGVGLTKDAPDVSLDLRFVKHFPYEGPSLKRVPPLTSLNPLAWLRRSRSQPRDPSTAADGTVDPDRTVLIRR